MPAGMPGMQHVSAILEGAGRLCNLAGLLGLGGGL